MAGAVFGEVQVSLSVAGAVFGEVQVSVFGEVEPSLFVAGLGSCSDHSRIGCAL